MVNDRDAVAIFEIIVYIPLAILALINCIRHGFKRSSGWIYTFLLCVVRIAGAICQFVSHSDHSTGLIQAMVIFDSIGLSPLLLATLGLLHRFVDFINGTKPALSTTKFFRLLQVLITVGLILSIVGGTSSNVQPDGSIQVDSSSKVGILLLLGAFVGITVIFLLSVPYTSHVPTKERRVPLAIIFALPLILTRIIYSACVAFIHNHTFNIVDGSIGVRVCMAILEEFFVIVIYVTLGFMLDNVASYKADPPQQAV